MKTISIMPGRTPEHTDPIALQTVFDTYFDECKTQDRPPTKNGLLLAMGLNEMDALRRYAERDDEIATVVKRALRSTARWWEERMGGTTQVAGPIFWLKNDGWRDQLDVGISSLDLYTDASQADITDNSGQEYDAQSALVDS